MDPTCISVVIADDHPLILAGLASVIEAEPELVLLGQASNADGAVAHYLRLRPDVLLVDLNMPGGGIDAIARVRRFDPQARIVVLTTFDGDEDVHRSLAAGASGYLLKGSGFDEIVACLRQVLRHGHYLPAMLAHKLAGRIEAGALSPRERDILSHLGQGKSNKRIADDAGIGVGTVKYHVNNILSKLDVASRSEAVCVARQRGLLHS